LIYVYCRAFSIITRRAAFELKTPPNARLGRRFEIAMFLILLVRTCGTPCNLSPVTGHTAREGFRRTYFVFVSPPGTLTKIFRTDPDLCFPDTIDCEKLRFIYKSTVLSLIKRTWTVEFPIQK
jgi:hypothetical protein